MRSHLNDLSWGSDHTSGVPGDCVASPGWRRAFCRGQEPGMQGLQLICTALSSMWHLPATPLLAPPVYDMTVMASHACRSGSPSSSCSPTGTASAWSGPTTTRSSWPSWRACQATSCVRSSPRCVVMGHLHFCASRDNTSSLHMPSGNVHSHTSCMHFCAYNCGAVHDQQGQTGSSAPSLAGMGLTFHQAP